MDSQRFQFSPNSTEFLVTRDGIEFYTFNFRLDHLTELHVIHAREDLLSGESMLHFRLHKRHNPNAVQKKKPSKKKKKKVEFPEIFEFITNHEAAQQLSAAISKRLNAIEDERLSHDFNVDLEYERNLDKELQIPTEAQDTLNLIGNSRIFKDGNQRKVFPFFSQFNLASCLNLFQTNFAYKI